MSPTVSSSVRMLAAPNGELCPISIPHVDKDHARDLVGAGTFLVNERELQVQAISNGSSTNRSPTVSSSVRMLAAPNGELCPISIPHVYVYTGVVSDLVLDITDKDHARDLVGAGTFLVNERELQVQASPISIPHVYVYTGVVQGLI
jgi:2-keto-3-deoxy-6-phosphogluconate aldolase